jgi:transcriptional regulator of acetoin/glycerol metabolism
MRLNDLANIPLNQLLPKAIESLRGATLDELAELLTSRKGGTAAPASAPARGATSHDDLAQAIISLPVSGSKLGAAERAVVLRAMETCKGNVSAAARLLGVNRKALERRIRRIKKSARD